MQFVYKPEGVSDADAQRWDFAPGKLMNVEAEVIERKTGMVFAEWTQKVQAGSMLALHGLLFVMLKRANPTLKWEQVVFNIGELDFELSDEESAKTLAALEARAQTEELAAADLALIDMLRRDTPPEAVDAARAELEHSGRPTHLATTDDQDEDREGDRPFDS